MRGPCRQGFPGCSLQRFPRCCRESTFCENNRMCKTNVRKQSGNEYFRAASQHTRRIDAATNGQSATIGNSAPQDEAFSVFLSDAPRPLSRGLCADRSGASQKQRRWSNSRPQDRAQDRSDNISAKHTGRITNANHAHRRAQARAGYRAPPLPFPSSPRHRRTEKEKRAGPPHDRILRKGKMI